MRWCKIFNYFILKLDKAFLCVCVRERETERDRVNFSSQRVMIDLKLKFGLLVQIPLWKSSGIVFPRHLFYLKY